MQRCVFSLCKEGVSMLCMMSWYYVRFGELRNNGLSPHKYWEDKSGNIKVMFWLVIVCLSSTYCSECTVFVGHFLWKKVKNTEPKTVLQPLHHHLELLLTHHGNCDSIRTSPSVCEEEDYPPSVLSCEIRYVHGHMILLLEEELNE